MTDEERAEHICNGLGLPREARASFVSEFAQVRQAERERLASLGGDVEALAKELYVAAHGHSMRNPREAWRYEILEVTENWKTVARFVAALIGAERERVSKLIASHFVNGFDIATGDDIFPKIMQLDLCAPSDATKDAGASIDMPKGGEE